MIRDAVLKLSGKTNTCAPLFLVTQDSRKAFDVVNHVIMLDKLYESGILPALLTIVKKTYTQDLQWKLNGWEN